MTPSLNLDMDPAVSIIGETFDLTEGSGSTQFTFLINDPVPSSEVITIDFEIVPDTAISRQDYEYQSSTAVFIRQTGVYADRVTIPGGASISSFFVDIPQDQLVEGDEVFTVKITGVSPNVQLGTNTSIAVTIKDDESSANQITIEAVSNITETDQNGQFVVNLSKVAAIETVVAYSIAGTATIGADYTALTGEVTIPAGSLSAAIDISVIDDQELEGQETVTVTLDEIISGDTNVGLGVARRDTLTITDDTSTVLHRLNVGGPEIAAIDGGPSWLADSDFLLNPGSNSVSQFTEAEPGPTAPLSTLSEIFDTEGFDSCSSTGMQYGFNVDPGFYKVHLYMGNGFDGTSAPKSRMFDVAIEGQVPQNLNHIDLSANFGHLVGGMVSHVVNVTDGILNIQVLHDMVKDIEDPLVSGIEIIALSA